MNAIPTDPRARALRTWQDTRRAERDRIKCLLRHDREAARAAEMVGHPNQPDDHGADGEAMLSRPSTMRGLEAISTGTVTRGRVPKVKHMTCECQLDWLYVSKLLNRDVDGVPRDEVGHRRWACGIKFRRLWLASAHSSRVSGSYGERLGASQGMSEVDYRTGVRIQVDKALSWLSDPQKRAVTSICGADRRAGLMLPTLIRALDALHDGWADEHRRRKGA